MPEWYRADKYKSVAEQAKAQRELETKLGAFVGAPKDGKYVTPAMPEGVEGEFDMENPVLQHFTKWAAQNQLSQAAYNEVLGMLAVYEYSRYPTAAEIKEAIGADADTRIASVSLWAKANLTPEQFEAFRAATAGPEAATVFKLFEAATEKLRGRATPKVGDTAAGDIPPNELEQIREAQAKVNPATGRRFFDEDPKYRSDLEARRIRYFNSLQPAA